MRFRQWLSNISFLHQTTTWHRHRASSPRCQISLFYIKPQRHKNLHVDACCCQISLFYIKPQPKKAKEWSTRGCQISLFYIKPQLVCRVHPFQRVVKYLFSTSNHNQKNMQVKHAIVVKYLFSTSNHNFSYEM